MANLTVLMPDGERRIVDGNTLTQAQALEAYNQGVKDWQSRVVADRINEQRMMGSLAAQAPGGMLVDPTRPTQSEAANTHKITRTASVKPQRWQTNGGANIGSRPQQAWPSMPSMDSVTVTNTGQNPLRVAELDGVLRNGGGITVAAGATFTISVQGSGWIVSDAGTTADIYWLFWESPDTNLPPEPKGE